MTPEPTSKPAPRPIPRPGPTLPIEKVRPSSPWAIAAAIATCLLVVAAANTAAAWYLDNQPVDLGTAIVERKWEIIEEQTEPVDWLILGDSSCNQGVDPTVLEQRLGGTALNLCTLGDMLLLNDAWMLQRYVARVGPPKHVVIVHVPDVWEQGEEQLPTTLLAGAIGRAGVSDGERDQFVPPVDLGADDWVTRLAGDRLPLYTRNASVVQVLRHPWPVDHGPTAEIRADGFMAATGADPQAVDADAQVHAGAWRQGARPISTINRAALVEIARLAAEHSFDVTLANAPLYEGLYANPTYRRAFDVVQRDLQTVASESKGFRVVFQEPMTFPRGLMQNADHLVEEAARSYSLGLADVIGPAVTSAREDDPVRSRAETRAPGSPLHAAGRRDLAGIVLARAGRTRRAPALRPWINRAAPDAARCPTTPYLKLDCTAARST